MICIGIDPGTHTGVAVWDSRERDFISIETLPIHRALLRVSLLAEANPGNVEVVFEDARQRTWFGRGDVSAKMQGAGSIKRDCSIWEDFCNDNHIPFRALPPIKGFTKLSPERFARISKYKGRTSEHARDAAMLVIGRR